MKKSIKIDEQSTKVSKKNSSKIDEILKKVDETSIKNEKSNK